MSFGGERKGRGRTFLHNVSVSTGMLGEKGFDGSLDGRQVNKKRPAIDMNRTNLVVAWNCMTYIRVTCFTVPNTRSGEIDKFLGTYLVVVITINVES